METLLYIGVIVVVFIILFKVFKIALKLLAVLAFLFLAFATNPSEQDHVLAVERKAERTGASLDNKTISSDDYYVFSLTTVSEGDASRTIGAGAFTQVFVFGRP